MSRPFHVAEAPNPLDAEVQAWIEAEGEGAWDRVAKLVRSEDPAASAAGLRGLLRFGRRAIEAGDCRSASDLAREVDRSPAPDSVRLEALRLFAAAAPVEEVLARLGQVRSGSRDPGFRPWLEELEQLAGTPRCERVDLPSLLERVRALQQRDLARWTRFRFRREVSRERLKADGSVQSSERWLFEIRPHGEGFDEELVRVDGEEPERAEIVRHREAGRFEKHWRSLRGGAADEETEGVFSLRQLLEMSAYEDAGVVEVEGLPCRRLDFSPHPGGSRREGLAGRLADAMEGSLFVSLHGSRVVRAEARTARAIRAYGGLAGVRSLEVEMVQAPVAEDLWLPKRIDVGSRVRVLFGMQRKRNSYVYSLFRPVEESQ